MLKNPQLVKNVKFTEKKPWLSQLPPIAQRQSSKILNLSNVSVTQDEIDILKLGLSFTPTPKQSIVMILSNVKGSEGVGVASVLDGHSLIFLLKKIVFVLWPDIMLSQTLIYYHILKVSSPPTLFF